MPEPRRRKTEDEIKRLDAVRNSPLALALSCAVPLRIMEYERSGGPTEVDYERCRGYGDLLGEKGDILQFRGGKPGETAKVFNALADGLAVMAFCPGGVTFCGTRYHARAAQTTFAPSQTDQQGNL